MSEAPYIIYGAIGSPYSVKMRAILRYRRIPHIWVTANGPREHALKQVKAPVIPVFQYPDGSYKNDSTPLIHDLEQRHGGRSIVPTDEATAFVACLLEDMADELGTKMMFHYRWFRERDQQQMSEWLCFDELKGQGKAAIQGLARKFRDRQVGRMALVGCTEANAPLIEASARRVQELFEGHVTEVAPFLFGSRPSLADFSWYGQLSQLATDPTPQEIMRASYPFTYRWLGNIDDASGVDGEWAANDPLPAAVQGLLALAGEIYFPFLRANAAALAKDEPSFSFTSQGLPYTQGTFKYQLRCLQDLRRAHAALSDDARDKLASALRDSGCLDALTASV